MQKMMHLRLLWTAIYKYNGTSASGKPPAFGAGIPQVRILSSQRCMIMMPVEVSLLYKKEKLKISLL
jgi:hypothetical protein